MGNAAEAFEAPNATAVASLTEVADVANASEVPNVMHDEVEINWTNITDTSVDIDWSRGLHGVVGQDGVLMIALTRDLARFNSSKTKLEQQAWISPTLFQATDS